MSPAGSSPVGGATYKPRSAALRRRSGLVAFVLHPQPFEHVHYPVDPAVAEARQHLRSLLFSWLEQYGTGKRSRTKTMRNKAKATTDSERIRQLEKENAKLREERDILRKAAKYFAEETR